MSLDASEPTRQRQRQRHPLESTTKSNIDSSTDSQEQSASIPSRSQTPHNENTESQKHSIQHSDDSSFNEPIPSEHPSPVGIDEDIKFDLRLEEMDLHIEEMEPHDEEEKQSSPTPTSNNNLNFMKKPINASVLTHIDTTTPNITNITNTNHPSAITPSTLYHLTSTLNVNDLPIHSDNIDEKYDENTENNHTAHTLSELFIRGGRKYWQNIQQSANINENSFYVNEITTGALDLTSMFDENVEIDLSALGLIEAEDDVQATTSTSTKHVSTNNTNTPNPQESPITPQPRPSQIFEINNNSNVNIETTVDDYKDEEAEDTMDDSDYIDNMDDLEYVSVGISPKNVLDNVPFGIGALFNDATHPDIIALQMKDDEKSEIDIHLMEAPPVLVPMRSFKDRGDPLQSIEEQYKKAQRQASNPEIIVPCSDNIGGDNQITIYNPLFEETTADSNKSFSPESPNKSLSPDLQALMIDYELETVPKKNIVRRLSFPLTKIDEIPLHIDQMIIKEDSGWNDKRHIVSVSDNVLPLTVSVNDNENDDEDMNDIEIEIEPSEIKIENVFNDNEDNEEEKIEINREKENEIKLKEAQIMIDTCREDINRLMDENEKLSKSKQDLVNRTSQQIEEMRDEIENMWKQLQLKDNEIRRLIHIGKEGYDPDHEPSGMVSAGNNNSISGLWTYARSKFSSSFHTVNQTKQSKIDLAISTATEIQRLRDIIRKISTKNHQSDPGTY